MTDIVEPFRDKRDDPATVRKRRLRAVKVLAGLVVLAIFLAWFVPFLAGLGGAQRDRLITIENRTSEAIELTFQHAATGKGIIAYEAPAGETVNGMLLRLHDFADRERWMQFPADYRLVATGEASEEVAVLDGPSTGRVIPRNVNVHIVVYPGRITLIPETEGEAAEP